MIKASLYYFKLAVGDPDALARFYCDAFGMKEVRRYDARETADPHLEIFLSAGQTESDNQIVLVRYTNKPVPTPGEATIAFMVEDVDAAVAVALTAGGTSTRAAETLEEHKFRWAVVTDPEGHSIELMQFTV